MEFEGYGTKTGDIIQVEEEIIKENLSKIKVVFDQEQIAKQLLHSLNLEKDEGERVIDFESRLTKDLNKIFNLE